MLELSNKLFFKFYSKTSPGNYFHAFFDAFDSIKKSFNGDKSTLIKFRVAENVKVILT